MPRHGRMMLAACATGRVSFDNAAPDASVRGEGPRPDRFARHLGGRS